MFDGDAINNIKDVTLPIASVGACRNNRNCKNYQAVLGNGLCVDCDDRGLDNRYLKQRR